MLKFYPILKTKRLAELKLVKRYKDMLFNNDTVLFLEFTKSKNDKIVSSFLKELSEATYIGCMYPENGKLSLIDSIDYANYLALNSDTIIPCCYINIHTDFHFFDELNKFIVNMHNKKRRVALRIQVGVEIDNDHFRTIASMLYDEDLIFVDLADGLYNANIFYLEDIRDAFKNNEINVLYQDRNPNMSGKDYANNDYDPSFNTDIIDRIKKDDFCFDGFGTYCGAKNNLVERSIVRKVYPVFPLYDFKENKYFTFSTNILAEIYHAYTDLKDNIGNDKDLKDKLKYLLSDTSIAKEEYHKIESKIKNNTPSEFIFITILQFIESIKYNLSL